MDMCLCVGVLKRNFVRKNKKISLLDGFCTFFVRLIRFLIKTFREACRVGGENDVNG